MLHKPYFIRYRQALERSLSAQNSCKKAAENDIACCEDSAQKTPDQNQSCAVDEQSNKMNKDTIAETADKNAFQGFRQIAPGIFQFKPPAPGIMGNTVPPGLFPPCYSEVAKPQKAGELGFIRLDGLPGPYHNYRTPVFQFT